MSEPIDLPEVLERVQDDKELLSELFDIFLEDYVGRRAALGEAIESNDAEKIREVAHGLKGSSGNISAKAMHVNCKEMEDSAKEGDISTASEKLALLDQQFEELKAHIAKLKPELAS